MWKLIARIRRKPGLSHEEFRAYYERTHAPLATPYLRGLVTGYSRNYVESVSRYAPEEGAERQEAGADPFDCVTIMEFRERGAIDELMARLGEAEILSVIVPDEERFIDRARTEVAICEEARTEMNG